MDTMNSRLKHARIKAGFTSARAAALRFGWSPSTYGAHENGQNNFDSDTAMEYAKALNANAGWLMLGSDQPVPMEHILLAGQITSWDDVHFFGSTSTTKERQVSAVSSLPSGAVAFKIIGTGLWPRYDDGALLIFMKHFDDLEDWIDWDREMIVILEDGKKYFRMVSATSTHEVYDLRCPSLPTIANIARSKIKDAFELWIIFPPAKWNEDIRADLPSVAKSTIGLSQRRQRRKKT